MSVIVARDRSTVGHIVFPWPEPLPWGAELVCADNEVAVICPNWEVGQQLGPGRHTISPPNPQSHTLAYFISTAPQSVSFDRTIAVIDGSTGQPVGVRFFGSAQIKIGDPLLLCHQLVGLPYHDLATGILRSANLSICRTFQHVIVKICMAHATVSALGNADAVAQLVNMAAGSNPMAVAVTGLELMRFERFGLALNNGEPIMWQAGSPGAGADNTASSESSESDLDADTQSDAEAAVRTGQQPPVQPAPPAAPGPGQPMTPPGQQGAPPPQAYASRQSNPQLPTPAAAQAPAGRRKKTPPLGSPIAPQSGEAPLPAGSQVLVYWNDGLWHTAVVRHFEGGRYQVALDGSDNLAWVQASQIRPA